MSEAATLSEEFEIAIPKDICDTHGWTPGQQFALLPTRGGLMPLPVPELAQLVGIADKCEPSDYRDHSDREDRY